MYISNPTKTKFTTAYTEFAAVTRSRHATMATGWVMHFPDGWYLLPRSAAPDFDRDQAIAGPIETFEAACAAAHLVTWPEYQ